MTTTSLTPDQIHAVVLSLGFKHSKPLPSDAAQRLSRRHNIAGPAAKNILRGQAMSAYTYRKLAGIVEAKS